MQNSHNKLRQGDLLSSHYWAEIWTVSINWKAYLETIGYIDGQSSEKLQQQGLERWSKYRPSLPLLLSATTSTKSIFIALFSLHVHMQLQILYVLEIYIKVCRIMTKEDCLCFQIWSMRCLEVIIDESDGFWNHVLPLLPSENCKPAAASLVYLKCSGKAYSLTTP